jgi:hypothetical protein
LNIQNIILALVSRRRDRAEERIRLIAKAASGQELAQKETDRMLDLGITADDVNMAAAALEQRKNDEEEIAKLPELRAAADKSRQRLAELRTNIRGRAAEDEASLAQATTDLRIATSALQEVEEISRRRPKKQIAFVLADPQTSLHLRRRGQLWAAINRADSEHHADAMRRQLAALDGDYAERAAIPETLVSATPGSRVFDLSDASVEAAERAFETLEGFDLRPAPGGDASIVDEFRRLFSLRRKQVRGSSPIFQTRQSSAEPAAALNSAGA